METFSHQVAGHITNGKSYSLIKLDDKILKPITNQKNGEREIEFYELLKSTNESILKELRMFVPKYHGCQTISLNGQQIKCIVMEDITQLYKKPSIMDVKIGKRTWDPMANQRKIDKENNKYFACKNRYHFCIPGFQVYQPDGTLIRYDKEFGKKLDENTTIEALKLFLNATSDGKINKQLISQFLDQLNEIGDWINRQKRMKFYSSSILLIYETDQFFTNYQNFQCSVKMIDFAHAFPDNYDDLDVNYKNGVDNLIKLFVNL